MATRPRTTVLADDPTVDAPQSTTPGDAPADTFDATEEVSSATPDKAAAAAAGYQSVNAVQTVDLNRFEAPAGDPRTEQVFAYDATGAQVTLDRDIVTGETTAAGDEDPEA